MRQTLTIVGLMITLTGGAIAQRNQAEIDLQAAIRTETVDGNLQKAIGQYRDIVSKHKGDRFTVATALVRMAECFQKAGDSEANKIYEQIVREYSDQKDAVAVARARLRNEKPGADVAAVKGDRPVWTGPLVDMFGQVSPDGRFITYVDWAGTASNGSNLIVHDVVTNTDRPLTTTGPSIGFSQYAEFSTISRDGRQVAYAWFNDKNMYDVRVVPLHGKDIPQPRVIFHGNEDFRDIAPRDWSPNGEFIAVTIRRKDATTQIGLLKIADGSLRIFKTVEWRGANKILFSPDGRWISYDQPTPADDRARHIYVMATDGTLEHAVVAHASRNTLMAWAPEGRHILFASDRAGETALWAQAIESGKAVGQPSLVKRDIGSTWPLGLTQSGSLYVYKGRSANYVQVAGADFTSGKILPPQSGAFQRFIGSGGSPDWSHDGKSLAYSVCPPQAGCAIAIASPDTGEVREIHPKMSYLAGARWSADGQSFLTDGTDLKGKRALYRIHAQTGDISFVHERPGAIVQFAPDEKKIYYRRGGSIVERDLASSAERELFQERAKGNSISIKVSPDGQHIAAVETAGTIDTLYLIPVAGGAPREILRAKSGQRLDGFRLQWTPDNRALVIPTPTSTNSPTELWFLPIDSATPRRLDFNEGLVLGGGGFAIHPNGRQVAFVAMAGRQAAEVWALENFLPKAK
jgi:Tol biopolymer transport system component